MHQLIREFQRTGIRFLLDRQSALLCDEMGLGKTLQALLAASQCTDAVLVACPANAIPVWKRELEKFGIERWSVQVHNRQTFRHPRPGELGIISWDSLPENFGDCPRNMLLIGDEAHYLVNKGTKRHKRWHAYASNVRANGGRTWMLTGTPILNHPGELWSLIRVLGKESEFGGFESFARSAGGIRQRVTSTQWIWTWSGIPSPDVRSRMQSFYLRRTRAEVTPELPTKAHYELPIVLPPDAEAVLDRIEQRIIDEYAGESLEQAVEAALNTAGSLYDDLFREWSGLAMAKTVALWPTIEEYERANEPLVVFTSHRSSAQMLGSRPGWGLIEGGVDHIKRGKIEEDFRAGRIQNIAATIRTTGMAIRLERAANAIFINRDWTPPINAQAEDRLMGLTQKRAVSIFTAVSGHRLDRLIENIWLRKQVAIEGLT